MITNKQRTVALLDADSIVVKAACTGESFGEMKDTCMHLIRKWTKLGCADTCKVFLSQGKCFRYDVYEGYKANRVGRAPIPHRKELTAWLMETYPQDGLHSDPKLEADDRLGYYATEDQDEEVRIIVSIDKDMEQVPTWVMNPDKWRFPTLITPEQAKDQLMFQWINGDPVDGYKGIKTSGDIKKYGRSKFDKWVDECVEEEWAETIEEDALDLYVETGHTLTQAYQQYLCATIKHHHLPDYAKCLTVKDLETMW